MWMAYAEACENEIEIFDLKSAIVKLQCKLERLAFDANHESIYGMDRFYSISQCRNLAESYKSAYKSCERYLTAKINIDMLVHSLEVVNLTQFVFRS